VRRSEFDHVLLRNAAAKGTDVHEGCRVTAVEFVAGDGAVATAMAEDGGEQRWRARFVVDATGRDTFLANRLELKQRNRRHESAAVYGHYTDAKRLEGRDEGNISIFWFTKGWFWFIPLSDGTTSVGAVCPSAVMKERKGDVTEFFRALVELCPALSERLRDATLTSPATATGNYSYGTDKMFGEGYILVGDASMFIDPVFSTGVYLAMRSAFMGADAIVTCLDRPAQATAALEKFERDVVDGRDRFNWFIYRITSPAIRKLFMAPSNIFRIEEAVLSLLAGDLASNSPIRSRLFLFKVFYYLHMLASKLGELVGRLAGGVTSQWA
jgi:flavin-dependent dehydrogenase